MLDLPPVQALLGRLRRLAAPLALAAGPQDPQTLEDGKVRGAIQTDFILSAEIMAITLGSLPDSSFWMQAVVLALVGIGMTLLVYGAVALIVKADDWGVAMALHTAPASGNSVAPNRMDRILRPFTQALGRGLVKGMPPFLILLGAVGTAAMLWVGGGILLHGMETLGPVALPGFAHDVSHGAALAVPSLAGSVEWVVHALLAGLFGVMVGASLIPVVSWVIRPLLRSVRPASRG